MKLGIRIWVLIAFVLFSIVAISPKFDVSGVEITNIVGVAKNQGINAGDIIKEINGVGVNSVSEFRNELDNINIEPKEIKLTTDKGIYRYNALGDLNFSIGENLTIINSGINGVNIGDKLLAVNDINLENISDFEEIKYELLPSVKVEIKTNKGNYAFLTNDKPDIDVREARKNNIKKGLELEGGTRVLLKPISNTTITSDDIQDLIVILRNRLNVYGLTDLKMREASSGEDKLVLIEIAGVSKGDIEGFISQQGKFEAKIGDKTAFSGEKKDIVDVCRDSGVCAGVSSCGPSSGGYSCRFQFELTLSQGAAKNQAEITKILDVVSSEGGQNILSKQIDFYLDNNLIDSLNVDASLKGSETTKIQITGPGFGVSEKDALENANSNMKKLQTVLITGSLPFNIEIVKLDSISPVFGQSFIKNTFFVGFIAMLCVLAVIFIRYRQFKVLIPMAITLVSELLIILGLAALIGWNLDLAAIAGIIAAIGTGVDDQIVITDEIIKGERDKFLSWRERIKRAFGIILVAYFSMVVAMLPLWSAAAGLLRGFAITTILGVSIGVFVTRPAFASMLEKIMEKN